MSKIVTVSLAAIGLLAAPAAIAQSKPAKPVKATVSPQQLVCELTGDCGPSAAGSNSGYTLNGEQPFSLDPNASAGAPKPKTPTAAMPAPGAKPGKAVVTRASRPMAPTAARPAMRRPAGPSDLQVTFLVGKAEMTPQGKANADVLAGVLASPKLSMLHVRIEGHTDAQGARDMNLKLSQDRAQAIVDYLVDKGISRDRLEAQGFGSDKPLPKLAPTSPANRRAVAIVIPDPAAATTTTK